MPKQKPIATKRAIMIRVLGLGDVVADNYLHEKMLYPGGNALNFAVYAKELGVDSDLLAHFGDDEIGRHIQNVLVRKGIGIQRCQVFKGKTTPKCSLILKDGERTFLEDDTSNRSLSGYRFIPADFNYVNSFHLVHLSCYSNNENQVRQFNFAKTIVSYDFSCEQEFQNEEYLKNVCPHIDFALVSSEKPVDQIKLLISRMVAHGTKYVLVTRGIQGQLFYDGQDYFHHQAKSIKAIDTCGAGDSFIAAFLIALLKQGYRKNQHLSKMMVDHALEVATNYSGNNCLRQGSFGYGLKYSD